MGRVFRGIEDAWGAGMLQKKLARTHQHEYSSFICWGPTSMPLRQAQHSSISKGYFG